MKKIEATIPPSQIHEVREALSELLLYEFVVTAVEDIAPRNRRVISTRGTSFTCDSKPALRLEMLTNDSEAEAAVDAISLALIGFGADTRIIVSDVQRVISH